MPIFEYECSECGNEFEHLVLQSSSPPQCPRCQSQDITRVLSLFSAKSSTVRERALRDARKRAGKVRFEKEHEEHKRIHKHRDHEH